MGLVPFIIRKIEVYNAPNLLKLMLVCVYVLKWLFQSSAKVICMLWASMIIQQYNRKSSANFSKFETQCHNYTSQMAGMLTKTVTSEINNLTLTISHKTIYPLTSSQLTEHHRFIFCHISIGLSK